MTDVGAPVPARSSRAAAALLKMQEQQRAAAAAAAAAAASSAANTGATDDECPLCLEHMDITDLEFKPCDCDFQCCCFCFHRIMEEPNPRCPNCRAPYDPEKISRLQRDLDMNTGGRRRRGGARTRSGSAGGADSQHSRSRSGTGAWSSVNGRPGRESGSGGGPGASDRSGPYGRDSAGVSRGRRGTAATAAHDGDRDGGERGRERYGSGSGSGTGGYERGGSGAQSRYPHSRGDVHTVRVIQRNLVYVVGLPLEVARDDVLRRPEFFGQYGKIAKVAVNKHTGPHHHHHHHHSAGGPSVPSASAYVTFVKEDDAATAIECVDGISLAGHTLRAQYGTTKYCSYFLRGLRCNSKDCTFLHEWGPEADIVTKDDLTSRSDRLLPSSMQRTDPSSASTANPNGHSSAPHGHMTATSSSSAYTEASERSTDPDRGGDTGSPVPASWEDTIADDEAPSLGSSPAQPVRVVVARQSPLHEAPGLPSTVSWASKPSPVTTTTSSSSQQQSSSNRSSKSGGGAKVTSSSSSSAQSAGGRGGSAQTTPVRAKKALEKERAFQDAAKEGKPAKSERSHAAGKPPRPSAAASSSSASSSSASAPAKERHSKRTGSGGNDDAAAAETTPSDVNKPAPSDPVFTQMRSAEAAQPAATAGAAPASAASATSSSTDASHQRSSVYSDAVPPHAAEALGLQQSSGANSMLLGRTVYDSVDLDFDPFTESARGLAEMMEGPFGGSAGARPAAPHYGRPGMYPASAFTQHHPAHAAPAPTGGASSANGNHHTSGGHSNGGGSSRLNIFAELQAIVPNATFRHVTEQNQQQHQQQHVDNVVLMGRVRNAPSSLSPIDVAISPGGRTQHHLPSPQQSPQHSQSHAQREIGTANDTRNVKSLEQEVEIANREVRELESLLQHAKDRVGYEGLRGAPLLDDAPPPPHHLPHHHPHQHHQQPPQHLQHQHHQQHPLDIAGAFAPSDASNRGFSYGGGTNAISALLATLNPPSASSPQASRGRR